jgi:hypothetical protein
MPAAHQMRLRPPTPFAHGLDRPRHPAPLRKANPPSRQGNYFQTGNVPQRRTAASRRASCFDSAHDRNSIRRRKFRSAEMKKKENQQAGKREQPEAGN